MIDVLGIVVKIVIKQEIFNVVENKCGYTKCILLGIVKYITEYGIFCNYYYKL